MRKSLTATCILLTICVCSGASAATWYVDGSVGASGDGTSWETAKKTIQEGIDAASDGDTVIVAQGTYTENIRFNGKDIVLRSTDPLDPVVVGSTVIDGNHAGSAVTFDGTEDRTCVLSGFTIRNGDAEYGGGICGGTVTRRTRATIQNSVITANSAISRGGGLAFCDGLIQNNTISANSSQRGGGLYVCHGVIENNAIVENSAWERGGGLIRCDGRVRNNRICGNSAGTDGGAMHVCDAVIENNIITDNSATQFGGGLVLCDGIIQGNTIARNSAGQRGGGLFFGSGRILNCIISQNTAPTDSDVALWQRDPVSCYVGGSPRFIDPDGPDDDPDTYEDNNYRLFSDSPCIDAGRNEDWMWGAVDLDGNPRLLQGTSAMKADVGAYEYVPPPTGGTWYVDKSVAEPGDGKSWGTAFGKVQEGIDSASSGDKVLVAAGTYTENINFKGRNVVLQSSDKSGALAVSNTIIDGGQAGPVVTFAGTEDQRCVLRGFTIRNGKAESGGGIFGQGLGMSWAAARIENNVVTDNSAQTGGGLSKCGGPILNNTISCNQADQGSAMYHCGGVVRNCIVWGNTGGGHIYPVSVAAYSCVEGGADGEANVPCYPYFTDAVNDDYHLESWSPCIDVGDPGFVLSDEPGSNGGRINIGAYGNTPEAIARSVDTDKDRLPDAWEMELFGNLARGGADDPDGDLISNIHEYYRGSDPTAAGTPPAEWHVDASVAASGDGSSWDTAFKTIEAGIDAATHGDTVIVGPGVYPERIDFGGKNIVVRSTDPLNSNAVSATIIDGAKKGGAVVTFSGVEDQTCVLSGFTIRNGSAENGGGILGGSCENPTRATILNNVITANSAQYGGGLSYCDGCIKGNEVTANSAQYVGGGLSWCHGMIESNRIVANSATQQYGNGGGLWNSRATIQNNVISDNQSAFYGGGAAFCYGDIRNNTITGNSAGDSGGGLSFAFAPVLNCIIWANEAPNAPQMHDSSDPTYSCIQDRGWGEGNISDDPQFVNSTGGDYHLSQYSPCIDKGKNEDWMVDALALNGSPRIIDFGDDGSAIVDMGAYEAREYIPPVLTLNGDPSMILECGAPYVEPGYSANDNYDGVITDRVMVTGSVDPASPGTYALTYNVRDSSGNAAPEKVRQVEVRDTIPPVITLLGDNPMTIQVGTPYVEPGYTATDSCDGDVTAFVDVSGSVDSNTAQIPQQVL